MCPAPGKCQTQACSPRDDIVILPAAEWAENRAPLPRRYSTASIFYLEYQ